MQHTTSEFEFVLDEASDQVTSAFLVAALSWADQHGFWQPFRRLLAVPMKTVTYSPLHKVQTLVASLLVGCHYNKDINTKLVPDTVAAAQLGLDRFPDQSQTNILLQRLDEDNLAQLQAVHQEQLRYYAHCPSRDSWHGYLVVDVDQSGLLANGKSYELSRKGYFPHKRGQRGYQLSCAYLSSSGVVLAMALDPGNVNGSTRLREMADHSQQHAAMSKRRMVLRLDAGYGGKPQVNWLLQQDYHFILKSRVQRADKWAAKVEPGAWRRVAGRPEVRVAEVQHSPRVRSIVCAVERDQQRTEYSLLLTDLPASEFAASDLWVLYSGRQSIEAFFKSGKGVYGMANLRSRKYKAIYGFLWLVCISHNLLRFVQADLLEDSELGALGTRALVERVGSIQARAERTATGWRLHLPGLHALARLLVSVLAGHQLLSRPRLYET